MAICIPRDDRFKLKTQAMSSSEQATVSTTGQLANHLCIFGRVLLDPRLSEEKAQSHFTMDFNSHEVYWSNWV